VDLSGAERGGDNAGDTVRWAEAAPLVKREGREVRQPAIPAVPAIPASQTRPGTHRCCRSASSLCSRSTWPGSSRPRGRRLQRHRRQGREQADAHSAHNHTGQPCQRAGEGVQLHALPPSHAQQASPRMAATVTRGEVYRRARKRLLTTQNSLQQQQPQQAGREAGGSAEGTQCGGSLRQACRWCCSQAEPPSAPPAAPKVLQLLHFPLAPLTCSAPQR
jgi:hypothetical protein